MWHGDDGVVGITNEANTSQLTPYPMGVGLSALTDGQVTTHPQALLTANTQRPHSNPDTSRMGGAAEGPGCRD